MVIITTIILTIAIISLLFFLFYRLKTPYYRVDKVRMAYVLEMVLTGQATDNDWNITFGMVIRHSPELEKIRLRCVDIEEECYIGHGKPPYLFSKSGLEQLQIVLRDLHAVTR